MAGIRITNAVRSLTAALADTGFPDNPVVVDALKIIEAHVVRLCPKCEGFGMVRITRIKDRVDQLKECHKCKGTGRQL